MFDISVLLQWLLKYKEIIGTLIVTYPSYKWIFIPGYRKIKNFMDKVDFVHDIVKKELAPNHGSSLKDQINRIDKQTAESTEKLWTMMELHNNACIEFDEKGQCVRVSRKWSNLCDLPMESAMGSGWIEMVHFDDREKVMFEWKNAISQTRTFDMTFRTQNNFHVHCLRYPMKSFNRKLIGWMGILVQVDRFNNTNLFDKDN